MKFQLFQLIFLCAAVFSTCVGSEVVAQEQKESKPESKQVDPAATQKKEQPQDPKQAEAKKVDPKQADPKQEKPEEKEVRLLDVEMTDIRGQKVDLKKYEGKVVLVVNVASKCGFTGQYRPLQALHTQYHQHGFEVIAFPCNQFGKQEPANEPAISAFCQKKFGIKFDMFAKVDVKGDKQVELFKRLTQCELKPAGKGDIRWNFEKFLIGKDGKPVARFRSNVAPDSEKLVSKVKEALGIEEEKKPEAKEKPEGQKPQKPSPQKAEKKKATKVKEDKKS